MANARKQSALYFLVFICFGPGFLSPNALAQLPSTMQDTQPFQVFFDELANTPANGGSRRETAFMKLVDSIRTMPPEEVVKGLPVIDRTLDNTAEPLDSLAQAYAAQLLMFIAWRPDGSVLLASQFDRLTAMLNDPSPLLSHPATLAFQYLAMGRPDLVIPILEAALKAPDLNSKSDIGPGIATILLRIAPNKEVTESVVQFMRRPDLTNKELIDTIVGINNSPVIPDALTAELVRSLDRRNESVTGRALIGIARSSPAAKDAARSRIKRMAEDPSETAHVRRLAAEALAGQTDRNPDLNK